MEKLFGKKYTIGLDIGPSSIKVAQYLRTSAGAQLVSAFGEELPIVEDAMLHDEAVVLHVKQCMEKLGLSRSDLRTADIVVAINCPKTAIASVVVPRMPIDELREAIPLHIQKVFPFPIDEKLAIDVVPVAEVVEGTVRQQRVLVAVSPQETIDAYQALLHKAGIKATVVLPSAIAIKKAVESLLPESTELHCVIDMGQRHTDVLVFEGKELLFYRKLKVAGLSFSEAMTHVLSSEEGNVQLTLDEAEEIKRTVGIPLEGTSERIQNKISSEQVLEMVRPVLEQFVTECERCFSYCREIGSGKEIAMVMLVGGGVTMKGLAAVLADEFGVRIVFGNPLDGIQVQNAGVKYDGATAARLTVALGAGLPDSGTINFLPREKQYQPIVKGTRVAVLVAGVTGALIAVLVFIGVMIGIDTFEKRIDAARMQSMSLQPQLENVTMQQSANAMLVGEPYWERVFKALSEGIPDDMYYLRMNWRGKILSVEGILFGGNAQEVLLEVMRNKESALVHNVRLAKVEEISGELGTKFEFRCRLREEGSTVQ